MSFETIYSQLYGVYRGKTIIWTCLEIAKRYNLMNEIVSQ